MIQEKENIDYYNQRLVFAGKELEDNEMIGSYPIAEEATLEVLFKMAGGVIEPTLAALAKKYNCDKMICRKCYARLPPRGGDARDALPPRRHDDALSHLSRLPKWLHAQSRTAQC